MITLSRIIALDMAMRIHMDTAGIVMTSANDLVGRTGVECIFLHYNLAS